MKNFILIFIFTLISTTIFAQNKKIQIGIEVGPNISIPTKNNYFKLYPKIGGYFGGFIQYNLKKIFYLRSGFAYSKIGLYSISEITGINAEPLGKAEFHNDLFFYKVPVLIGANFGKKIKFFANTGINITSISKAHYYFKSKVIGPNDFITKGKLDKINIGFLSGLGLSIPLSKKLNTTFECRYNNNKNYNALNFIFGFGYNIR